MLNIRSSMLNSLGNCQLQFLRTVLAATSKDIKGSEAQTFGTLCHLCFFQYPNIDKAELRKIYSDDTSDIIDCDFEDTYANLMKVLDVFKENKALLGNIKYAEKSFNLDFKNFNLSGTVDAITEDGYIVDYKVVKSFYPVSTYLYQLSAYAYLARAAGFNIKGIKIFSFNKTNIFKVGSKGAKYKIEAAEELNMDYLLQILDTKFSNKLKSQDTSFMPNPAFFYCRFCSVPCEAQRNA